MHCIAMLSGTGKHEIVCLPVNKFSFTKTTYLSRAELLSELKFVCFVPVQTSHLLWVVSLG